MVNSIEKKDFVRKIRQLISVHFVNARLAGFQIQKKDCLKQIYNFIDVPLSPSVFPSK